MARKRIARSSDISSYANFKFNPRSIFFKTIFDENQSNPYALGAGLEAKGYLSGNSIVTQNNQLTDRSQQKIKTAMTILSKGINKEREVEQDYFNKILRDSKLDNNLKTTISNRLNEVTANGFDYIAFINLINEILQGKENYEATIRLERQRTEQLAQIRNTLLSDINKNIREANENRKRKRPEITQKELDEKIKSEYLKKHTVSTYSKYFEQVSPTIDQLLAERVNEIILDIFNNKQLMNDFSNNPTLNSDIINVKQLKARLLKEVMQKIRTDNYITTIVDKEINKLADETINFTNSIIEKLFSDDTIDDLNIPGLDDNFANKKIFQYKIDKKNKEAFHLVQFWKTLSDKKDLEYLKNQDNIFKADLIDNQSELSQALAQLEKATKDYKDSLTNQSEKGNIAKNRQARATARRRVTNAAKTIIEREAKKAGNEILEEGLKKIGESLNSLEINVEGWKYAEVISIIEAQLLSSLSNQTFSYSGPKNFKADAIRIFWNTIKMNSGQYKSLSQISNIDDILGIVSQEMTNKLTTDIEEEYKSTNYEYAKNQFFKIQYEAYTKAKEQLKIDENNKKALEELANYFKNNIIVTETVKSFKNYQNDIGFISGSIGSNISNQINNFATFFEDAGCPLTQDEIDWLQVAIVNCSPFALGSANKGPIETYLSTLAGFAIFDEGSAEIKLITNQAQTEFIKGGTASGRIMHLYRLNGLYFPGSFILQKIYDHLAESMQNITNEVLENRKDGAKIRATASPSIINHKIKDAQERWANTFDIASGREYTSIEITFLSGLFDIVRQLGEIQI